MNPGPVLILGGGSDIGRATAHRFARAGHPIILTARKPSTLEIDQKDISLRYEVSVTLLEFDAFNPGTIPELITSLPEVPEYLVCAIGLLAGKEADDDAESRAQVLTGANFVGPGIALEAAAKLMATREGGATIIGISSVAGDRGRAANMWYGAAKAGFTAMLSGLRQSYSRTSLRVVTIKPGYVRTKMIAGLETPNFLTTSPERVADQIYARRRSGSSVIYVGPIWAMIMMIIRLLPERIFMRLQF